MSANDKYISTSQMEDVTYLRVENFTHGRVNKKKRIISQIIFKAYHAIYRGKYTDNDNKNLFGQQQSQLGLQSKQDYLIGKSK